MAKNWEKLSRSNWSIPGASDEHVTEEQLVVGCLQRVATALETIATKLTVLVDKPAPENTDLSSIASSLAKLAEKPNLDELKVARLVVEQLETVRL